MRQLLATLRHRPGPLLGVLIALIAAASMITWAFSLTNSGSSSTVPAGHLAGAAVVVTGNPDVTVTTGSGYSASASRIPLQSYRRVPASLAARLAAVLGVRAAVAQRSIPVALMLPGGRVAAGTATVPMTAYGWPSAQLTPFTLRAGHAPEGSRQLVAGAGLAKAAGLHLGEQVRLAGEHLPAFEVAGIAAAPRGGPAGDQTVFVSAAEAAALYGHPGEADLIGVVTSPGTAAGTLARRVRAALGGGNLDVVTGTARGAAGNLTAESDLSSLASFGQTGVIFVLAGLFVVASTAALSVAGRARTMALLRAVGATPGQVRRKVTAELAALGLLGGLAGYPIGNGLAALSLRYLAGHGLVPSSARPWASPVELVPSVCFGIAIAELSGLPAAWRASRVHPGAALQEARIERRSPRLARLVLGIGAMAGGVVYAIITAGQSDASQQLNQAQTVLVIFMAGAALLGPYLTSLAELALRLPLRLAGGTPGRLAAAQIRARPRRMAAAVVAIAMPVAFASAIMALDAAQVQGARAEAGQRLAASAVVSAPGPGLNPAALTAIRSRPGITAAIGLIPTTVYIADSSEDSAPAEAVTPGPIGSLLHLDVVSGSLARFGRGDIALSALVAGEGAMNVRVGQVISTDLADGTRYRAKVTAIYSRSLGFADVIVPATAAGGGHLGDGDLGEVLVGTRAGTSPGALTSELGALARGYPGLRVASRAVASAQDELADSQTSDANNLLLALVGLLAAVALVNTLVMTVLQGRDELLLLRRVGATISQLAAMTAWEAASVTLLGAVLGAAAAGAAIAEGSKALTGSWTSGLSWSSAASILALVMALTAGAISVPAFWSMREGNG
jgi:putative ABC transport system permease protein